MKKFLEYWRNLSPVGKRVLAKNLAVTLKQVEHIAHGRRKAGVVVVARIEWATNGYILPIDLRPDIVKVCT